MTTIDGARLPGRIPNVPGATLELLELESVRTGRSRGELVALAVAAMFAPPIEDPAPLGEAPGQGTTRPPAPTIVVAAEGRLAGAWPVAHQVLHFADGEATAARCGAQAPWTERAPMASLCPACVRHMRAEVAS